MSHRSRQSLYSYLEDSGVLDTGTDADIKRVKSMYWKEYRRLYKQAYRRKYKSILTTLSHSLYEDVTQRVKQLDISIPEYIRTLLAKKTVTLGTSDSKVLAQTISRIYTEVQNLVRNHITAADAPPYLYDELLKRIEYLEAVVLKQST